MVWGKIAATEANHNVDTAVFSLWDSVFYLTKNLVMGISVVGEEGVVQRCPFLFFVYVCFFVCLFVFSILQGCIALETRSCMKAIMEKISR